VQAICDEMNRLGQEHDGMPESALGVHASNMVIDCHEFHEPASAVWRGQSCTTERAARIGSVGETW